MKPYSFTSTQCIGEEFERIALCPSTYRRVKRYKPTAQGDTTRYSSRLRRRPGLVLQIS